MSKEVVLQKAKEIINTEVRPMILGDGGDIEVFNLRDDGYLEVKMSGSCTNCSSLPLTLTFGIEERLKVALPEIKGIIQI